MSDAPADTPDVQRPEEQTDQPETDWKARYEKLQADSRKWETRAKDNAKAAQRLAELEDADKSDLQRLTERAEAAEKELGALRLEKQTASWRGQVAKETGVPVEALRGSSLEELQAHAETLKPFLNIRHPYIPAPGDTPITAANADELFASALFKRT